MLKPVGVTITPQRVTESEFGETQWADLNSIDNAVIALSTAAPVGSEVGKVYTQSGALFVPRGSDLRNGDRFTYQGKTFGVVGDAQWDMNQPFANSSLGYVEYAIRLGG